jgi:hypothetical protein
MKPISRHAWGGSLVLALCLPACGGEKNSLPTHGSKDCQPRYELSIVSNGAGWEARGIAVTGGAVYSMRPPEAVAPQVIAFDAILIKDREVTGAQDVGLLHDANDGAVLLSTGESTASLSLIHIDDQGERRVIFANGPSIIDPDFEYQGRARMLVDRTGAAWRTTQGVARWDVETSSTQTFLARDGDPGQPSRSGARVAWTVRRASSAVLLLNDSVATTTIAVGDVASPAVSGSLVFYLEGGRLVRYDLEAAQKMTLHEGPCAAPFAEGERAVAACGGGNDYVPPGAMLVYWDGVRVHELFDGGHHYAPRLDDGIIAWIRYRSLDVLCMPPPEAAGGVMLWDPELGEQFLGETAAHCLCCNAYSPPAELDFEGGVLASNYASSDGYPHRFSFAVIERRRFCE